MKKGRAAHYAKRPHGAHSLSTTPTIIGRYRGQLSTNKCMESPDLCKWAYAYGVPLKRRQSMRAVQWLKVIRPNTESPTEHHAPTTPRICLDLARVDSVAYRLQPLVQRQFGPTQLRKGGRVGKRASPSGAAGGKRVDAAGSDHSLRRAPVAEHGRDPA